MIISIAIAESHSLNIIEKFCRKVEFLLVQKIFTSITEARRHVRKYPVDLIFLDAQMLSHAGADFFQSLSREVMVILLASQNLYAVEGFNLNVIDYLLKPFNLERFMQAVHKAFVFYNFSHQQMAVKHDYLFIRADYSLRKIPLSEILYIEGLDDYLKIYLPSQKTVVAKMTMKAMTEKLSSKNFVRVHRSFIVPIDKIQRVHQKTITLSGNNIPIGISYRKEFLKLLKGE